MNFAIDQQPSPKPAKVVIPEKPAEDPRAAEQAKIASNILSPARRFGWRDKPRTETV